jgi:transposase
VWIAGGGTVSASVFMPRRMSVQQGLGRDPHAGEIFCLRGRKGDLVKPLWHNGVGMSLYTNDLGSYYTSFLR